MKKRVIKSIGIGVALGIFFYWQNNGLTLTEWIYEGGVPKAFDGYRILQVADLQNKVFGREQARLLRKMENAEPDCIVITGDLLDRNRTDVEGALQFVRAAKKIAPVYFVSGNHEHQSGEWHTLEEGLLREDVKILDNGKSVIAREGDTITLLGLADKRVNPCYEEVLHTLMAEEDGLTILLSHRPELFETYAAEGVKLAFTGHAHGGQIRLPGIGGIFAPNQGFFPQYTAGMHWRGDSAMVVSRGLGNSVFPIRFCNRPELVLVTLKA